LTSDPPHADRFLVDLKDRMAGVGAATPAPTPTPPAPPSSWPNNPPPQAINAGFKTFAYFGDL